MLRRLLIGRASLFVTLALVLAGYGLIMGCGGGNGSVSSGYTTVGTTGPSTGALQLNPSLATRSRADSRALNSYDVPANVTDFRLTFLDDAGNMMLTTTVRKATQVVVNYVPTTATFLLYELLDGTGQVVGSGRFKIVIQGGQVFVVDNPPFDPVVTGTVALLSTKYYLSGTDSSIATGGTVTGTLTFDGNGNVTAGRITRKTGNSIPPTTQVFNVTAGTYTVAGSRDFTANLTTDVYPLQMSGRVTMQPSGGAIYASLYGGTAGPIEPMSAFTTLQVSSSGFSNANLNGTLMVAAFNSSSLSNFNGYLTGTIVADGNGNWTGGSLLTYTGTTVPITGGTYTVAADGQVTGIIQTGAARVPNPGMGNITVSGAVGADQVLALAGVSDNNVDQLYLLGSPKPASVRTVNVPASMRLVGARSVDGTIEGTATFSSGTWTMTGGTYNDYTALFAPIVPSQTNLPVGAFAVTESAELVGGTDQAASPFVTVGGVFTTSEVVFFSALKKADGNPAASNALLMVLVK